jgi:hypothetical protein
VGIEASLPKPPDTLPHGEPPTATSRS